ncbi:MAG: WecB/TagA/CpsF family glycosyltransferase [Candidatus Eremiobacterota bacterium]
MEFKENNHRKINIFGSLISAVSLSQAVFLIEEKIHEKTSSYICVCPVSSIVTATEDREFQHIINNSFISTPDGMPVVWYLKSKGAKDVTRVYGPDLMREVFYMSETHGYRHYFYGGTEEILSKLKENLLKKFPSLNICGMYAPPFRPLTEKEEEEVISDIKKSEPHIVWVGIGSPKQEKWMAKISPLLDGIIMAGVGAAFNFYAGSVRQAPLWMQRNGLEWLFRLWCEPGRLWKRYLYGNSRFIYMVLREMIIRRDV